MVPVDGCKLVRIGGPSGAVCWGATGTVVVGTLVGGGVGTVVGTAVVVVEEEETGTVAEGCVATADGD
jgi:hypothetical protein